jgi:hypothetical protein
MNIRNVIERLRKIYNSNSEDFTKCELMENILRAYQRSIEDRIMTKFHNGFFDISIHTTRSTIRKKINAIADLINMQIEGLLDNSNINLFVCYEENQFYVSDDLITTTDNRTISQDAFENDYFTCQDCQNICHNDDSRTYYENDDDLHCYDCVNDNGWYCDYHDDTHHEDYNCEENEDEDERVNYNLDAFDKRIFLHFLGKAIAEAGIQNANVLIDSVLFYGIEVELHTRHEIISRYDIVEKFRDTMNYDDLGNHKEFILCKHDGSLHADHGFELVSTNATFHYHKKTFWNNFFEINPNEFVKAYHGYNCGIHIHFSRSAFTTNQLRRLNCFYNNPQNRNLIVEIAGRDENNYCKFHSMIDFNSSIKTHGCKYSVINFDNKDTVEVRIFRSNIKQISFFRYLEFVHTVNLWIRSNHKNNADNLHHNDYFDWLLKNVHKDYANLLIFLDDKEHFEHLKHIEEWKTIYSNFKDIVHDFRINNSELINQELESEN